MPYWIDNNNRKNNKCNSLASGKLYKPLGTNNTCRPENSAVVAYDLWLSHQWLQCDGRRIYNGTEYIPFQVKQITIKGFMVFMVRI